MRIARWLQLLSFLLILAGMLIAFGLWRLARDDERLTQWLVGSIRKASGLELVSEPGAFGFWPVLSITLKNIVLVEPGRADNLAKASLVSVTVPWQSLLQRQLHIGAVRLEGVIIESEAFANWLNNRPDQGPPEVLHWPEMSATLEIADLEVRRSSSASAPTNGFKIQALRLDHWLVDQVSTLEADIHIAALAAVTLHLHLECTPRQSSRGIAIEPCTAHISSENDEALRVHGYARWQDLAYMDAQLRLSARTVPAWAATDKFVFDPKPSDLALHLSGANAGPLQLELGGTLAGIIVDGDLLLPLSWLQQVQTQQFEKLAEQTTGYLKLDQLRIGTATFEGIEWRNQLSGEVRSPGETGSSP